MEHNLKVQFQLRALIASLFLESLRKSGKEEEFLDSLGITQVPVVIPVLGDTKVSQIRSTVERHLSSGEPVVVLPVLYEPTRASSGFSISVLAVAPSNKKSFWELGMNELHDDSTMGQVLTALDSNKSWDIGELDAADREKIATLV